MVVKRSLSTTTAAMVSDSLTTRALVLGMVGPDGRLHAEELYDVADVCGYTVHQVRLCLSRLVEEGVLTQQGRGRKAVFDATEAGHSLLDPEVDFVRLAWAQDAGVVQWDGSWHLVAFSIDEGQRAARNALRDFLVNALGGGYVVSGLYASAHPWEELVLDVAERHQVADRVFLSQSQATGFGGFEDPRDFARRLWDIEALGDRWDDFTTTFQPVIDSLPVEALTDPTEAAATLGAAVRVANEFSAIMHTDPLLPSELLPERWPGVDARRLMDQASAQIAATRSAARIPALYRRFDSVMAEVGRGEPHLRDLLKPHR